MKGWILRTDFYVRAIEQMPEARWISLLAATRLTVNSRVQARRRRRGPRPESDEENLVMLPSDAPSASEIGE